jgi:hypothetical protein
MTAVRWFPPCTANTLVLAKVRSKAFRLEFSRHLTSEHHGHERFDTMRRWERKPTLLSDRSWAVTDGA